MFDDVAGITVITVSQFVAMIALGMGTGIILGAIGYIISGVFGVVRRVFS